MSPFFYVAENCSCIFGTSAIHGGRRCCNITFIVLFVWQFKQGLYEKMYAYDKKKPVNRKLVLLGNLLLDNSQINTQEILTLFHTTFYKNFYNKGNTYV